MSSQMHDIETSTIPMRPLRVSFFVNFVHQGGTYFRFHNLAIGLTRLGHYVAVFAADHNTRSHTRREIRDGVTYHIVPESPLNRLFGRCCDPLTIANRFARQGRSCDVAHLFQPFPSAAAAWYRADARVRFYDWDDLWVGGWMSARARRWRDYWSRWNTAVLEQRLPQWADHVTAISGFLADLAWKRGARGVSLLNSGSWVGTLSDRKAARRQLGLRPEALYAGFMGRTAAELPWCFEALAENMDRHPALRLAVCGAPASYLEGLSAAVRERIDYLGQLTPADASLFAACLDLGLIPLEENPFNKSRLPQKFGDHLATGVPLLCSNVGECARLMDRFAWAIPAGGSRLEWLSAFREAINRVAASDVPAFDPDTFREQMSWDGLSQQLAQAYYAVLDGRSSCQPSALGSRSTG